MSAMYGFADFEVDIENGTLRRRGYAVPLQDQPFRLLALLLERAGTVVTREEIQSHLWPGNTNVEFDQSLRVAVSKLREALRDNANEPIYIATVPRRGYRFIAPVTLRAPVAGIAPAADLPDTGEPPVLDGQPSSGPPNSISPIVRTWWQAPALRLALLAIAITCCVAVPSFLIRARLKRVLSPTVAAHPQTRQSVAVIGLRNLSGAPEDRWLSTALAEMLSTELAANDRLRVISGEEVARAGLSEPPANTPSHETLARFGSRLGADMIVFGSYTVVRQRTNSTPSLRLDLRLENLSSDAPPVALVESGKADSLFTLVSASGSQLRQHLGLGDLPAEANTAVRRTLPANPLAAEFYSQGLQRLRDFDPLGARELLQKAIQIEPGHAGTHLALADTWHAMGYNHEAQAEAAKALELGGDLPRRELLHIQAEKALYSGDWAQAIQVFRSLVTFYPDNIDYGLRLAQAQSSASQDKEALVTLQALQRNGISRADAARIDLAEALTHLRVGDFRESVTIADHAIQIGSELDNKLVRAQALWIRSSGLERMGDSRGSLAASSESQDLYRAAGDKQGLGLDLMMSGDVLFDKAEYAAARKNFEASLDLFWELGHTRNMGILLERIGNSYFEEGALEASRKHYQMALDDYRKTSWDSGVASIVGNLANVEDTEGNIAGALERNRQGLDLFEKVADKRGMASTLSNMGDLELERGTLDQASADFTRAAEIDRQISYARGLCYALTGQGNVMTVRNNIPAAFRQFDVALKTIDGMDEPAALAPLKISFGIATLSSGDAPKAAKYFEQAVAIASKDQDHSLAGYGLAWLSRAQLAAGRGSDALISANQSVSESRLQFGPQIRLVATLALARAQLTQGNPGAARDHARAAAQGAQQHGYAPLNLEARILLAQTETSMVERHRQLAMLAGEAERKGWNKLAADARSGSEN